MLSLWLATAALAAPVSIEVTDVRNSEGLIRVLAWNTAEGFPGKQGNAIHSRSLPAAPTVRLELDLAPGTWAISVLHDEDGDGTLDTSLIGIPKEGVGASIPGGMSRLGPPRFEQAAFTVGEAGKAVTIPMVYLL